jgi:phage anti-repressor protein
MKYKYIIEIAQGSNAVDLNVNENQYKQTKDLFKTIDYDETISKKGDCITRTLFVQQNDFAEIWKKVLVDITTLDTIIKNK